MEEGVIGGTLPMDQIVKGREKLPFLKARRPEIYHLNAIAQSAAS